MPNILFYFTSNVDLIDKTQVKEPLAEVVDVFFTYENREDVRGLQRQVL